MLSEERAKNIQTTYMAVLTDLLRYMDTCCSALVELHEQTQPPGCDDIAAVFRAAHRGAETLARFTRIGE